MSRWFQNLIGILQADIVYNSKTPLGNLEKLYDWFPIDFFHFVLHHFTTILVFFSFFLFSFAKYVLEIITDTKGAIPVTLSAVRVKR